MQQKPHHKTQAHPAKPYSPLCALVYVPAEEYKPGKVDAAETKLNPLTALPGAKEAIQTCSLPSVPFV